MSAFGWIVGGTIVLPLTFVVGFTVGASYAPAAPVGVLDAPARTVTRTVRVPGPIQTITKTVRVPTFPAPPVSNADGASPAFPNVLRGGMVNNALRTTVWISIGPTGPFHPVTAEIDTGSAQTLVNGGLMQDFGDIPSGATENLYGITGNTTVPYYPGIWVWAYPGGKGAPIIAGGADPAGLGHSELGAEGVEIDLGQNVLAHGTLIQMQSAWQFQYQPQ